MSTEENKETARSFIAAFNKRSAPDVKRLVAPDLAKDVIENWFPTNDGYWSDQHVDITAIMTDGDAVWARLENTRRSTGEYRGLPPTGKMLTTPGIMFARIVGARIMEMSFLWANMKEIEDLGGKIVLATP
jgi:predicted ester cyclase